jgi:hypothetical protein
VAPPACHLPACPPACLPACLQRKMDKVKAALGHMHKLQEAQTKLAGAESALAKLQRAVSQPASQPGLRDGARAQR